MNVVRVLENDKFAKFAKGAAGAVYVTTAIKAIGRPAFIYADKNSDHETKKYTAGKEFLYQVLCLLLTVGMVPAFRQGGFKLAEKHLKHPLLKDVAKRIADVKPLKRMGQFEKEYANIEKMAPEAKKAMTLVKGGTELGSFVGSIIGLTIIAPLISHEILHPLMKALGMEKKETAKPSTIKPEITPEWDQNKMDVKA